MNPSNDLVNRLWRLCALLRKDGVTYQQYVTELTYLLFLKMASEQKDESRIPEQYRWAALKSASETEVLQRYRQALIDLGDGTKIADRSVVAIFQNAATIVREPANLRKLIDAIDGLHWFSEERDAFGDTYEGLLQKMAEETKRGAGQYFTPRVLIDVMVRLMQPKAGEVIQDPAAGTGGFLIAADRAMRAVTDDYFELSPKQQTFQLQSALRGLENVQDTFRLLLMNLHLHKIDPDHLDFADTLSPSGAQPKFKDADLILTNPPFGPAGGPPTRDDLTITDRVSSYQLPFVEHCIRALKLGGRAAVVVPDNVLFDDGRGKQLRQRLMNWCNLHTILRLPTGIFYAQGVKTNVLFFTRADEEAPAKDATTAVWVYDMRSGAPAYGKTNPLRLKDFDEFARAFGENPFGFSSRVDRGEIGRFRCFTREEIAARGDSLDIDWLKDGSDDIEDRLEAPEDIAATIEAHLSSALVEARALAEEADLGMTTPSMGEVLKICFDSSEHEQIELGSILYGIEAGKNLRCEERPPLDHELGVVKVSAVTWGRFDPLESKTLPPSYSPPEKARIRLGDLLISRANTIELVGAVVLVDQEPKGLFLSDKILRLVVDEDAKKWVLWFLRSPFGRKQIEELATGNQHSMRNISQDALRRIRLPFPPVENRRALIERVESGFARIDRLEAEIARTQELLARAKFALLERTFERKPAPGGSEEQSSNSLLDKTTSEQATIQNA